MKTFRNLSYSLSILSLVTFLLLLPFTQASDNMTSRLLMGIFTTVFAVSLVAFITSLLMYFHSKANVIITLKRRAARVYGELLHHKILLITAIDNEKPVSYWQDFLYDPEEFPRIKRFLGEEYFQLLSCDSFLSKSGGATAINNFKTLHEFLDIFIRSVSFDRIEHARFKKLYLIKTGKEMTGKTPVSEFLEQPFAEAYEAMQSANAQSLQMIEGLLSRIEKLEIQLDRYFSAGVDWKTTKKSFTARYQLWLHAAEI